MNSTVDIVIIGAGPAGLTAALRLQQLGYSVQLLERSAHWPRPQIGEALTPGVKNIIDLLDANHALEAVPHLAGMATKIRWRSSTAEIVSHGDSAIINRSAFDAALLQLAQQRGIAVCMPAHIQSISGQINDWRLSINTPTGIQQTSARFILDASGRSHHAQQINCAPRLSALWAELAPDQIPSHITRHTQVEALEHGWLWGARLPDQRYRIMLVNDPQAAHQQMPGQAEQWLRSNCATSELFNAIAQAPYISRLQACVATPYLALDSWQDGRLKLGDAAFALDPISSSGVEKAMRFSLQAVVALHTHLSNADNHSKQLARHFFEQRLIETCARHNYWTQSYYAQAWCHEQAFWQSRSTNTFDNNDSANATHADHPLLQAMQAQSAQIRNYQEVALKPLTSFNPHHHLRIHPAASLTETYCVVDNQVQKQLALSHPNLDRPIAFLENQALFPHLNFLWQAHSLSSTLKKLGENMESEKSQKITLWLWQRGLLESMATATS
jgi:2-polyprenyl-6-methoxyphenol hydroxylase-like FAD-dependent oxidoreductase